MISGIRLFKELDYINVQIESNSTLVVVWLEKKNLCTLWYLRDYWEELEHALQEINHRIRHIFREANKTADFLSWEGVVKLFNTLMEIIFLGCCTGTLEWENLAFLIGTYKKSCITYRDLSWSFFGFFYFCMDVNLISSLLCLFVFLASCLASLLFLLMCLGWVLLLTV